MNNDPREAQLSDIMYAIGMESEEACYHMKMLCSELKIPYPPKKIAPPTVDEVIMVCPYCGSYTMAENITCCGESSHGVRMTMKYYLEGKKHERLYKTQ